MIKYLCIASYRLIYIKDTSGVSNNIYHINKANKEKQYNFLGKIKNYQF
jgi:hypothetical protein